MNICKDEAKFNNFRILLDSGYSSTIVTRIPIEKLNPKKDTVMKWHKQPINITTNLKVNIYFTLHELSATKTMTWNCHVGDSSKGRYDLILGRYLLMELRLNI